MRIEQKDGSRITVQHSGKKQAKHCVFKNFYLPSEKKINYNLVKHLCLGLLSVLGKHMDTYQTKNSVVMNAHHNSVKFNQIQENFHSNPREFPISSYSRWDSSMEAETGARGC